MDETFALADDRRAVLDRFVPGSEEDAYHRCLAHQQRGELDRVPPLVEQWVSRHGHTQRVQEVLDRQALLGFERDRRGTLDHLRGRLGLSFDHAREVEGAAAALPTALDPRLLDRAALRDEALRWSSDLSHFTPAGLDALAQDGLDLDPARRRALLSKLRRPDVPRLPELVAADLAHEHSRGFGSHGVHALMTSPQLDLLERLRPQLRRDATFVGRRLVHLQPGPEVDVEHDLEARGAHLDRLWSFVAGLDAPFNALKAHVLFHRLELDLRLAADPRAVRERLALYLQLPRRVDYAHPDFLHRLRDQAVSLGSDFRAQTLLAPVHDDEQVVAALLEPLLAAAADTRPWDAWVREEWVEQRLATAKLRAGAPDRDRWAALLDDPSRLQALRDEVELTLAPTNRAVWAAADAVALEVDVKNVQTLVVKVYELNAFNYALAHGREVDASIDLDGLAPSAETVLTFDDPPLVRRRRRIEVPGLDRAGAFVVELIGGGRSSRAFLRKGWLRFVERLSPAGHALTVLDEQGAPCAASVWLGGRELVADEDGEVLIPFGAEQTRSVILRRGDVVSVEALQLRAETYALQAGLHVEREGLLARREAAVLVRARLTLHGLPVPLELLEDAALVLETTDRHGTTSSKRVEGLALRDDQESTHPLQVPPDLTRLTVRLEGRVRAASTGQRQELSASRGFALNGIDETDRVEALHLTRTADQGHVLSLLGKAGEPREAAQVTVRLRLREQTRTVDAALQTDARGRVVLGALPGVTLVEAHRPGLQETFDPTPADLMRAPRVVHLRAGERAVVPYAGAAREATHRSFSLLERRGDGFVRDHLAAVKLQDGLLEVHGLAAGDYLLALHDTGEQVDVRVSPGPAGAGWLASRARLLEQTPPGALSLRTPLLEGEALVVRVLGATEATRVHVLASRFRGPWSAGASLELGAPPVGRVVEVGPAPSTYASGRALGDEVRYVLERRYAKRRPGTLLARPGLLLNPWAMRDTDTDEERLDKGEGYAADKKKAARRESRAGAAPAKPQPAARGSFASLEFLEEPGVALTNLRPGADGVVRVPRAALGAACEVRVVAVDALRLAARELALPERPVATKDVRLVRGLDPAGHFAMQRRVTPLQPGEPLVVDDLASAKLEVVDTLAKVHRLFGALTGNADLQTFAFVLRWPSLPFAERCRLLSEHGCHELHVFIAKKDPELLEKVLRPHLRNKKEKRFIDRWLLGEDLSAWLRPWAHGRLNAAEKSLLADALPGGGEQAATARHLDDLVGLQPADPRREEHLFRTALAGTALDADDGLGLRQAQAAAVATATARAMMDMPSAAGPGFGGGGLMASLAAPACPPPPPMAKSAKMEALEDGVAECADEAPSPCEEPAPEPPELEELEKERSESDAEAGKRARRKAKDLRRREEARPRYRGPETTQELGENDYWHRAVDEQGPELVPPGPFWRDHARRDRTRPFLSANVATAAGTFTEMMLALAVLDLPFEAPRHQVKVEGGRLELVPAGPCLVFHEEVRPAKASERPSPVLVSQNLVRPDDRWRTEEGVQVENYVQGELLVHTVYACQVVLTNPTAAPRRLELLLQAPRGSVPVGGGLVTKGQTVQLAGYATHHVEYAFYFPARGDFTHFPAHVAKDGELLVAAPARPVHVVATPSTVDRRSWSWVSQRGSDEELLAFLRDENVHRLDLTRIAWRMRDRALFAKVTDLLARRHAFDATLWSYGLHHDATDAAREHLLHQEGFLRGLGPWLESPLVSVDPCARGWYQHKEYAPLLNPRAHRVGDAHRILNDRLAAQWAALLEVLGRKPRLDDQDRLDVAFYLLLMDRTDEGLAALAKVDPKGVAARLQLDYVRAYVAMLEGRPDEARAAAHERAGYPVDRWRALFEAVLAHLDEAEGKGPAGVAGGDDAADRQQRLAATEPSLELAVEGRSVAIRYRNLGACRLSWYLVDLEVLFSRQPFAEQRAEQFAYVRPNRTDEVALPADRTTVTVDVPEALAASNVVVEAVAGGLRRAQPAFAHALDVQVIEAYGQVKVTHQASGRPLGAVYVKAYARTHGGEVRFHKDGYTDLRGRFDYASVSTADVADVARFALLVLSDEHGGVVREAAAPPR